MSIKNSVFLFLLSLLLVFSCKSNVDILKKDAPDTLRTDTAFDTPDPNIKEPDIYITGRIKNDRFNEAVYWKNGVMHKLPVHGYNSGTQSIAIWKNKVYITGYVTLDGITNAVYWVDGVQFNLGDAEAKSIAVNDNGIFIAGRTYGKKSNGYDLTIATLWKNGSPSRLSSTDIDSYANCVTLDGNDVYVGGNQRNLEMSGARAVYWKNGVMTELVDFNHKLASDVNEIVLYGKDVYSVGHFDHSAAYWKNGTLVALLPDVRSYLYSMYLKGSAFFLAGNIYRSSNDGNLVYWKNSMNSVQKPISGYASGMSDNASLGVYNGHVYVPGFMRPLTTGSLNKAIYWRDNEVITLPADSSASTSDLVLVPVP